MIVNDEKQLTSCRAQCLVSKFVWLELESRALRRIHLVPSEASRRSIPTEYQASSSSSVVAAERVNYSTVYSELCPLHLHIM